MYGSEYAAGIADGVGGWNMQGFSSAKFSRLLMHLCNEYQKNHTEQNPGEIPGPMEILEKGYYMMPLGIIGSTTACIAVISEGVIHTTTLGDSSYFILRDGKILHRGPILEHAFNHPFQLSDRLLIALTKSKAATIDQAQADWPMDSLEMKHEAKEGDILLLMTDGILDNLWEKDIESITQNWMTSKSAQNITMLAAGIVDLARKVSASVSSNTPFQSKAMAQGMFVPGGKPDDMGVVACRVVGCGNSNANTANNDAATEATTVVHE